jgi:pimeloyl-ACP methyl ester carboxylesterase
MELRRPAVAALVLAIVLLPGFARTRPASQPTTRPAPELLLPDGPTDGAPLAVYLHPAVQPQLDRFRKDYWPLLLARKCVLLMPRASSKVTWPGEDMQAVVDAIDDVQKRRGTDPNRVLLMGAGGGAQLALCLADRVPRRFRAVVAIGANPVIVRDKRYEWFHPAAETAKTCPYFIVNHITNGDALKFWRQVRARREPLGASISILPVLGQAENYQPPPKELGPWLDDVLAGKLPAAIADPQQAAVAKTFADTAAALRKALAEAKPAGDANRFVKDGKEYKLTITAPRAYLRSAREDRFDAGGLPVTQLRVESPKWPIFVRVDARRAFKPIADIVLAEEKQTIERGLLYQTYHAYEVKVGERTWKLRIGSITYPDAGRGWVSALFVHATTPIGDSLTRWLELLILDETQQPDAKELAELFHTVAAGAMAEAARQLEGP